MEPASNLSDMQSQEGRPDYRGLIHPRKSLRKGQAEVFRCAASGKDEITAVLPTGYGKSFVGVGVYLIQRAMGMVDRCLWLVPTDALRNQVTESAEGDARDLGGRIAGACDITKEHKHFRQHRQGTVELFVATYAQVARDDGFFSELMSRGRWLVIRDEGQRLREDRAWGTSTARLGGRCVLNLTATPVRSDGARSVAVPSMDSDDGTRTILPDVAVGIRDAIEEKALRYPIGHVQHYFVDLQQPDGEIRRITTEELKEEGITDFSSYETRKSLRYCRKYLSRMLLEIIQKYNEKNMRQEHEHQALVFAMTTAHAEALAAQLNDLAGHRFADWIGVNRDQRTNEKVLNEYIGVSAHKGRRVQIRPEDRLPCLVQVDMASEGFNNPRTSILAFLHLIKSNAKLAQQIGRGLRRNPNIPNFHEDYCDVFASADTEIADYVNKLEVELEGVIPKSAEERKPRQSDLPLAEIPEVPFIDAEWQRTEIVTPFLASTESERHKQIREIAERHGITGTPEQLEQFITAVYGGEQVAPKPEPQSYAAQEKYWRERSDKAVKTLASNVIKSRSNGSFERSLMGDTIRLIHTAWSRHSGLTAAQMSADEHQRKYQWAREINEAMRDRGEVPAWLKL